MEDDFCLIHDDLLGYVPKPGFRGAGATGWAVTIDAHGFRCGGGAEGVAGEQAIVAVGDSYTFGEEVADEETWPAQLERLSCRRVLNGGASGYGFDQTILRAERLTALHAPAMVIVGFIADDIRRTEMRRLWGRNKPWFALDGARPQLAGVPVAARRRRAPAWLRHRLDRVLIALPGPLQQFFGYHVRQHPTGLGLSIAQHLIERLARLGERHCCRVVLLAQYHPEVWRDRAFATEERRITSHILDSARKAGLATVDTYARFAMEPAAGSFYGHSHLNRRGNAVVASLLAARLRDLY